MLTQVLLTLPTYQGVLDTRRLICFHSCDLASPSCDAGVVEECTYTLWTVPQCDSVYQGKDKEVKRKEERLAVTHTHLGRRILSMD